MNGVILIDKPAGFTSFDVIAVVRRLTGQRKAGHTGTLDPNATGVLPVLLGSATKAQDLIPNHDKSYVAGFRLGMTTNTLDIWGEVASEMEANASKDDILRILPRFRGEIEQLPPMFSAVQKNGQRLYDLARRGIEVEREKRRVTVYRLELVGFDDRRQRGMLKISCSKGTYVRTVIDDLGKALGTGAVMTELRRTEACGFSFDECISIDSLRDLSERGEINSVLRPTDSLFACYPSVFISEPQARRFSNGGALDMARTQLRDTKNPEGQIFRVYDRNNRFLGLGKIDNKSGLLKIYKLFVN